MLKAQTVRLTNGETLEDVTIVLIDEGISVISDDTIRHIYHQGILELVFSDPAAVHFMKGRNLAHWARDVEETREILEDFDFEFGELEQFLKEQFVKEEQHPPTETLMRSDFSGKHFRAGSRNIATAWNYNHSKHCFIHGQSFRIRRQIGGSRGTIRPFA
jgi:hypothetical protein